MTSMPTHTQTSTDQGALPVYPFDQPHTVPARELANLLGGKGAGLAEMTTALGLPVPPGFTVALPVCRAYREHGWPTGLDEALRDRCAQLGTRMGRRFGDPADPLLLAVRSGAPRSMPGMLDTVLNLGLNDRTVQGLARSSGDEIFAWDSYRRFVRMYASTVLGVPAAALDDGGSRVPAAGLSAAEHEVARLRKVAERETGSTIPDDPADQLRHAVEAVFRSWDSERAQLYRRREGISDDIGTAVNIQAMVFGNRGEDSGTGVVFTRDPATGEPAPYGDFLPTAQGEDVVSGIARTLGIAALGQRWPEVYDELLTHLRRLEVHYRDICDVEFTVENGRLWILQTRIGKRGAGAAVRAAVAMTADPDIALTTTEALQRVPPDVREKARAEALASAREAQAGGAPAPLITTGLGASPGRVSGRAVFDSQAAAEAVEPVILVRDETSPDDVPGMSVSVGVLTSKGGVVSHAAVVARGWGIPAVVSASELIVRADEAVTADGTRRIGTGDLITIDGSTGHVWLGALDVVTEANLDEHTLLKQELPELLTLEEWAHS